MRAGLRHYAIEDELKYFKKLRKRKGFHQQIKENWREIQDLARHVHCEVEIYVDGWTYKLK